MRAVGDVIDMYLDVGMNVDKIDADHTVLHDLSGTGLKKYIEEQRGHCSTKWNIKYEYLDSWLDSLSKDCPKERKILNNIFTKLSNADDDLFTKLAEVASYIQSIGQQSIKDVFLGDVTQAKDRIRKAAMELLELRANLEDINSELSSVKKQYRVNEN